MRRVDDVLKSIHRDEKVTVGQEKHQLLCYLYGAVCLLVGRFGYSEELMLQHLKFLDEHYGGEKEVRGVEMVDQAK